MNSRNNKPDEAKIHKKGELWAAFGLLQHRKFFNNACMWQWKTTCENARHHKGSSRPNLDGTIH
jgi:hypothetical protein